MSQLLISDVLKPTHVPGERFTQLVEEADYRVKKMRKAVDDKTKQVAVLKETLDKEKATNDKAMRDMITQLSSTTAQRDKLAMKEKTLLDRIQQLLVENKEAMFEEEDPLGQDSTISIISVFERCFAQLSKKQQKVDSAISHSQQCEVDMTRMTAAVRNLQQQVASLEDEKGLLYEECNHVARDLHESQLTAQGNVSDVSVLQNAVTSLFDHCAEVAKKQLQLSLADYSSRDDINGVIGSIKILVTHLSDKLQHMMSDKDVAVMRDNFGKQIEEERDHVEALERAVAIMDERLQHSFGIAPWQMKQQQRRGDMMPRQAGSAATDDDALLVTHYKEAAAAIGLIAQSIQSATNALSSYVYVPTPITATPMNLAARLVQVAEHTAGVLETFVSSANRIGMHTAVVVTPHESMSRSSSQQRVSPSPIVVNPQIEREHGIQTTSIEEWERAVCEQLAANSSSPGSSEGNKFLQKIIGILTHYGGVYVPTQPQITPAYERSRSRSTSQQQYHDESLPPGMVSLTPDMSPAEQEHAVAHALGDLLQQLVTQQMGMTAEWQALRDQNTRLQMDQTSLRERHRGERSRVATQVQELRAVVQKKIDDDRYSEHQMRELEDCLERQSREAGRQIIDRDAVGRLVAEMRSLVRHKLRNDESTEAMMIALSSHE